MSTGNRAPPDARGGSRIEPARAGVDPLVRPPGARGGAAQAVEHVPLHLENIFAELKVSRRTAAVNAALRRGIVHSE